MSGPLLLGKTSGPISGRVCPAIQASGDTAEMRPFGGCHESRLLASPSGNFSAFHALNELHLGDVILEAPTFLSKLKFFPRDRGASPGQHDFEQVQEAFAVGRE